MSTLINMEIRDYCIEQINAVKDVLMAETVQFDKYGDVENKVDLSFNTLSENYKLAAEAVLLKEQELVDHGDMSVMQDLTAQHSRQVVPGNNLKQLDSIKDPLNTTLEAKSVALKRKDSRKFQKGRSVKGGSVMQDSREETISDNEDSSMMMDDSNLENSNKKPAQHNRDKLLKDVLRGNDFQAYEEMQEENVLGDINQENGPMIDNATSKLGKTGIQAFGEHYLRDADIEDVITLLGKNHIFRGKVDLSGQKLTDQTLLRLSKIIRQPTPQITELNLQRNPAFESEFGTKGISDLAESIADSNCLQILRLGGIKFGFEAQW
jgi:hypothetical protein